MTITFSLFFFLYYRNSFFIFFLKPSFCLRFVDMLHCVKIVHIRSFFLSVFSCSLSEYKKIRTRGVWYWEFYFVMIHWSENIVKSSKNFQRNSNAASPVEFVINGFDCFAWETMRNLNVAVYCLPLFVKHVLIKAKSCFFWRSKIVYAFGFSFYGRMLHCDESLARLDLLVQSQQLKH